MIELARFFAALPYTIEVEEDVTTEGNVCFLARHPDLPGCMSHGSTVDEAVANLEEARRLFIESMLESGLVPPPPSASVAEVAAESLELTVSWTVISAASPRIQEKTSASHARGEILETERVALSA